MTFQRIYHPYTAWEDYQAGMWRRAYGTERDAFLERAIAFTGDAKLYGSWMRKVIVQWPIACEHNLTDLGMNRRAWIGHAACCLAIQCPEDITRTAWGHLTQEQRDAANAEAEGAIHAWERAHAAKAARVRRGLEAAGLPGGDTGRGGPGAREPEQGALL